MARRLTTRQMFQQVNAGFVTLSEELNALADAVRHVRKEANRGNDAVRVSVIECASMLLGVLQAMVCEAKRSQRRAELRARRAYMMGKGECRRSRRRVMALPVWRNIERFTMARTGKLK